MIKSAAYGVFHILISSLLSLTVMFLLIPDLLLRHKYSFIRFLDQEIDSYGVFNIISNFFHGGIQLWDNYNQMSLAYFYLNGGMTSLSNLFTAGVYILVSPILHAPAEAFQAIYSVVYFYGAILIRSAGFYLLLSRFIKNKSILLISTIFASTFLSPQSYLGLTSSNIFSFFPLVMHFILRLFETRKFKYVLLLFLLMVICVANYPLMGLGYFYLGVHLVLLSTIGWFLLKNKFNLRRLKREINFGITGRKFIQLLAVIILSFLILLPFVYMLKENYYDYDLAHETSRFANLDVFNVKNYFARETQTAPQEDFLYRMVDYEHNLWYENWLFIGITSLFLIACGIILSNDGRKYIFAVTALLFWLINSPRGINSMYSLSSIGHWIVALTDPFNFTLRSFHMTGALMLTFALAPLAALGLQSLFENHALKIKYYCKLALIEIIMIGIFLNVYPRLTESVRKYYLIGLVIISVILICSTLKSKCRKITIFAMLCYLGILLILDGLAMQIYFRGWLSNVSIIPQKLPKSAELTFIDFQNPLILPFRQFFTTDPQEWKGWGMFRDAYNEAGLYFHRTNLGNYFSPASIYFPKHLSYSILSSDKDLQEYLRKDNRLIYQADYAVPEQAGLLAKLIKSEQDRIIIQIDRNPHLNNLFFDGVPDNIPEKNTMRPQQFKKTQFTLERATSIIKNGLAFYSLELPNDFSPYLASDVFTDDSSLLQVKIGEKTLSSAQGNLIQPFTFDIQNMRTGYLTIALSPKSPDSEAKGELTYPADFGGGITGIWRYEPDNLGINYNAEKDGWLVFHYPYDKKWNVLVDGVKKDIYRVNYSFIGIPIGKGDHKILLQYWPQTWLREALALSIILLLVCPILIVFYEVRQQKNDCQESESN